MGGVAAFVADSSNVFVGGFGVCSGLWRDIFGVVVGKMLLYVLRRSLG